MHTLARLAIDTVSIGVFAAIGRASHHEPVDVLGVLETAWPFWLGAGAGWAICRLGRQRTLLGEGATVWLSSVVLGHVIRVLFGPGTQLPFIIVSLIALGLFLLGWRGLAMLASRRRNA